MATPTPWHTARQRVRYVAPSVPHTTPPPRLRSQPSLQSNEASTAHAQSRGAAWGRVGGGRTAWEGSRQAWVRGDGGAHEERGVGLRSAVRGAVQSGRAFRAQEGDLHQGTTDQGVLLHNPAARCKNTACLQVHVPFGRLPHHWARSARPPAHTARLQGPGQPPARAAWRLAWTPVVGEPWIRTDSPREQSGFNRSSVG